VDKYEFSEYKWIKFISIYWINIIKYIKFRKVIYRNILGNIISKKKK